ncbi:MAG: cupin domain-containing protein [Candidatus Eremiobacteraeota bacterium]|nr:cupin domain-containing protein [Candidatus Eremiobacteraeota bacterium]
MDQSDSFRQTARARRAPDATNWVPGTGGYAGTQMAVLLGDPTKSGMYIMRMKLPAGTTFPPHVHGTTENVTVISGALMVGLGKTVDQSQMKALPAGTFVSVPPNMPHYAMAKEETVIQIEGMGPETMTPVK